MNQNLQMIDCTHEFYFDDCQLRSKEVVFLIEQKYYRIYVAHYLISISDLIKFLFPKLLEFGVTLNIDKCLYLDSHNKELQENDLIQEFIHNIVYIRIIELVKEQQNPKFKYILDNEIENLLSKNLQDNEIMGLKTIFETKKLQKIQPYLTYLQRDALNQIDVLILGPANSPYSEGVFQLIWTFEFKKLQKPIIQFITPIYHPNFYQGYVKLNFNFDLSSPGKSFQSIIYYIIYLLSQPNLVNTLDEECAKLYKQNKDEYNNKAANFTQKFANISLISKNHIVPQNDEQQQLLNQNLEDLLRVNQTFFKSQNWIDYNLQLKNYYNFQNICAVGPKHFLKQRLLNELYQYSISIEHEMFLMFPVDNQCNCVRVFFIGPKQTSFDGGIYRLDLFFPQDYPLFPPKCVLRTAIYHPNIQGSRISVDMLTVKGWSQVLTIRTIILSIISLLDDPNPDDPLNFESALLYTKDRDSYNQIVEAQKIQFASPQINQLIDEIMQLETQKEIDRVYLEKRLIQWLKYWENFKI